jgi:hypothetical protein
MSTPSYSTFVKRHLRAHQDLHDTAERIAGAAPDWMDLMARGLTDALAAPLHLGRSTAAEPLTDEGTLAQPGSWRGAPG